MNEKKMNAYERMAYNIEMARERKKQMENSETKIKSKLADDIREAEKQLKDIEQNRFILIGKLQALRSVEAMLK